MANGANSVDHTGASSNTPKKIFGFFHSNTNSTDSTPTQTPNHPVHASSPSTDTNNINMLLHVDDEETGARTHSILNALTGKGRNSSSSGGQTAADKEKGKGFFVRTSKRTYIFQAETAGEAASWVIALRKFLASS